MKLNILMVQKQNLINLIWKPTQMVVEPNFIVAKIALNKMICIDSNQFRLQLYLF